MIVIRNGKINVVFCGIFTIGESGELGDVLHLNLHFFGVRIAAGGEDEEGKAGVGF